MSRVRQLGLIAVVGSVLLEVGCAAVPDDAVAFVISREATPPSGYQAAVDAGRIIPLMVAEPPSLGAMPMGAMPMGVVGAAAAALPVTVIPGL